MGAEEGVDDVDGIPPFNEDWLPFEYNYSTLVNDNVWLELKALKKWLWIWYLTCQKDLSRYLYEQVLKKASCMYDILYQRGPVYVESRKPHRILKPSNFPLRISWNFPLKSVVACMSLRL